MISVRTPISSGRLCELLNHHAMDGIEAALNTQRQAIFIELCRLNVENHSIGSSNGSTSSNSTSSGGEGGEGGQSVAAEECDIVVDFSEIARSTSTAAQRIANRPCQMLPKLSAAVTAMQRPSMCRTGSRLFTKCNVRLSHMSERWNFPVAEDVGRLVCLIGTVGATSLPKLILTSATFECRHAECARQQTVAVGDMECSFHEIESPSRCAKKRCKSNLFRQMKEHDRFHNYRRFTLLRLSQYGASSDIGHGNRSIAVVTCGSPATSSALSTGTIVLVVGVVVASSKQYQDGDLMYSQLSVYANSISRADDYVMGSPGSVIALEADAITKMRTTSTDCQWLELLVKRFCPELYGMWQAKYAIMLALACQSAHATAGAREGQRVTPHVLLCGDHHVGKSVLLDYVGRVARKSVAISASSTTAAGLTFAKSCSTDYDVEPGALVLADGGVCCVDNINFFSTAILESLKDAMESQRIVGTFSSGQYEMPTRCSLICASHGPWKKSALSTPFESRLDVILNFTNSGSANDWRRAMAETQLAFVTGLVHSTPSPATSSSSTSSTTTTTTTTNAAAPTVPSADIAYIRQVMAMAAGQQMPVINESASMILKRYYDSLAKRTDRAITARYMEALARLAMANARLMLRNRVTTFDAIMAVELMIESDSVIPLEFTYPSEGFAGWFQRVRTAVYKRLDLRVNEQ